MDAALAGMPAEWRHALLLRHAEGAAVAELAQTLGKAEPEVERILQQARAYLRQRLTELGCRFKESDGR